MSTYPAGSMQERVDQIVSGRAPRARRQLVSDQLRAEPAERAFSPFVDADLDRATELAAEMMAAAESGGGPPDMGAAMDLVEAHLRTEVPGLAQYALALFLTHYPQARNLFSWPPLETRQPQLVAPSRFRLRADADGGAEDATAGATPPEDTLGFWREDPLFNEHHEHWHLVYPMRGRPSPSGTVDIGDRHGELFAYMHEQMLARYDAERLAVGLPRVGQFDDYRAGIPQGYDPGELMLWDGDSWYQFRARPAGAHISDLGPLIPNRPGALLSKMEEFRDRLLEAGRTGVFHISGGDVPVRADNLGNTVEADVKSVDFYGANDSRNNKIYGNQHNDGHIHMMLFDNTEPFGVMAQTATAVRDPIFFRWHKHVDSMFQTFQNQQPAHDFSSGPQVKIRDTDLILALASGLPDAFDGDSLATEAFGHSDDPAADHWDDDLTATTVTLPDGRRVTTTAELTTEMLTRSVVSGDGTIEIPYLSHDDFFYFLRAENTLDREQAVTVRVFLAPETEKEDRTAWIELDRFRWELGAGERAVVFRPADVSSVIRKPALKPADLQPSDEPSPQTEESPWCDCGWPYTMLLPRGTSEDGGMGFRLLVMLSSGDDLTPPAEDHCTSISYCGLQDKEYPDKQEMGFPFNRPFAPAPPVDPPAPPAPISHAVGSHDNWAWRPVAIRCRTPLP